MYLLHFTLTYPTSTSSHFCYTAFMSLRPTSVLVPIFWVSLTYIGLTQGSQLLAAASRRLSPVLGNRISIPDPVEQSTSRVIEISLPPPPSSPMDIPEYVKTVGESVATQAAQAAVGQVLVTTEEITRSACSQVITRIQSQCGLSPSE